MPSTTTKQQRFMGMELAKQRKTGKNDTGMTEQQLVDFASSPVVPIPKPKKNRKPIYAVR